MGIIWKQPEIERIIAALLAAHPGFTPDYKTMAQYFGQGATYYSIEGRFRSYRKLAEEMKREGPATISTPPRRANATPGSSRVSKSGAIKKTRASDPATPSRAGKGKRAAMEAIILDDDSDTTPVKHEAIQPLFPDMLLANVATNPRDNARNGKEHAAPKVKKEHATAVVNPFVNGYVDDNNGSAQNDAGHTAVDAMASFDQQEQSFGAEFGEFAGYDDIF
ncbi:hypothetical protein FQN55_001066 [Onygenales sp. PD_40]|nr:hypothetical protein FQN55_001066 [Onygenales sp. PD_40]KAK2789326.1 hypothetical protein FQN53_002168 [Emmonsiellopsis sp. PD_33]KAK2800742.1 hypothetical protein FQN51_005882 [Onygenales sp. PD_10]